MPVVPVVPVLPVFAVGVATLVPAVPVPVPVGVVEALFADDGTASSSSLPPHAASTASIPPIKSRRTGL
jgi:hypothetical protein